MKMNKKLDTAYTHVYVEFGKPNFEEKISNNFVRLLFEHNGKDH